MTALLYSNYLLICELFHASGTGESTWNRGKTSYTLPSFPSISLKCKGISFFNEIPWLPLGHEISLEGYMKFDAKYKPSLWVFSLRVYSQEARSSSSSSSPPPCGRHTCGSASPQSLLFLGNSSPPSFPCLPCIASDYYNYTSLHPSVPKL